VDVLSECGDEEFNLVINIGHSLVHACKLTTIYQFVDKRFRNYVLEIVILV